LAPHARGCEVQQKGWRNLHPFCRPPTRAGARTLVDLPESFHTLAPHARGREVQRTISVVLINPLRLAPHARGREVQPVLIDLLDHVATAPHARGREVQHVGEV